MFDENTMEDTATSIHNLVYMVQENLSAGGFSIGGDPLNYEILDKDTMLLRFEMNVDLWAATIPINLSYTADYKVTEDQLTLDLFGYKVTFDRLE